MRCRSVTRSMPTASTSCRRRSDGRSSPASHEPAPAPAMTPPTRYLLWMGAGVLAVIVLAGLLFARLYQAFHYNPALNAAILAVLLLGIGYTFWQVIRLYREIAWLERYRAGQPTGDAQPRLLAPMAVMIGERRGKLSLSALSLRSLLDGLQARLMESHELSRYFIGLL